VSKFDIVVNSELIINLSLKSKLLKVVDVTSTKDFNIERNPTVNEIENLVIPKNKYWKMEVISSTLLFDKEKITSYETINFLSEHKLKGQHTLRNSAIILVAVLSYPVYWLVQYYKVASSELNTLENL
jgi:CRISPR/Cas system-associated protein endoribonuclease Cas2